MTRWLSFLPLVALAALAALFGLYALHRNPQVQPHALVGKPMPDLTLPSLDDRQPVRLREVTAGGPVLVNFFASWCAPCQVEAPALMKLKSEGVRIVGVAYEDVPPRGSQDATREFLSRLGDPYARRLVDIQGDPKAAADAGMRSITVRVFYDLAGKPQVKQATLNASKAQLSEQVEFMAPPDKTEYEYEIVWQLKGNRTVSSGRKTNSTGTLFVDELPAS